jgi:hypothetical protein
MLAMQKTPRDALAGEILDLLALAPGPELDRVLDRVLHPRVASRLMRRPRRLPGWRS